MTLTFRLAAFFLVVLTSVLLAALLTHRLWMPSIGQSLVCGEEIAPSDAIFVENFDLSYLLFERAAAVQQAGLAARVLVSAQASDHDSDLATPVASGIVELMGRLARVQNLEIIPMQEIEPYSLNAAYQLRDFLTKEHLRSIVVVVPALRSQRSSLVYDAVLRPAGIDVHCLPVFGGHTPENWATTWHGIEVVIQQFVKLQFYRFYVLRTRVCARPADSSRASVSGALRSSLGRRKTLEACERLCEIPAKGRQPASSVPGLTSPLRWARP